jgi:hypothetical protein
MVRVDQPKQSDAGHDLSPWASVLLELFLASDITLTNFRYDSMVVLEFASFPDKIWKGNVTGCITTPEGNCKSRAKDGNFLKNQGKMSASME